MPKQAVKRSPLRRTAWKRKPPDPDKAKAAQRKKQKRAREKGGADFGPHASWVRARGCEVPACPEPAEAHHQPFRSRGGTAKDLVGLCAAHHRTGRLARHNISLERFDREHGTDLLAAAARNWANSPYGEKFYGHLV